MKCPNCNREMEVSQSFAKRTYFDYDCDYFEAYAKILHYKCPFCKIEYTEEDPGGAKEWSLPENLKPTQKQIDYAKSIASRLKKDIRALVTRKDYSKFISQNVDEYKRKKKRDYDVDLYNLSLELEEWGIIDPGMFC